MGGGSSDKETGQLYFNMFITIKNIWLIYCSATYQWLTLLLKKSQKNGWEWFEICFVFFNENKIYIILSRSIYRLLCECSYLNLTTSEWTNPGGPPCDSRSWETLIIWISCKHIWRHYLGLKKIMKFVGRLNWLHTHRHTLPQTCLVCLLLVQLNTANICTFHSLGWTRTGFAGSWWSCNFHMWLQKAVAASLHWACAAFLSLSKTLPYYLTLSIREMVVFALNTSNLHFLSLICWQSSSCHTKPTHCPVILRMSNTDQLSYMPTLYTEPFHAYPKI